MSVYPYAGGGADSSIKLLTKCPSLYLARAMRIVERVLDGAPPEAIGFSDDDARTIILADILVSLASNYALLREYITMRGEQAYITLLGCRSDRVVELAKEMGMDVSAGAGGVYIMPLVDYIRATAGTHDRYIMACNQPVFRDGTVRVTKDVLARAVAHALVKKLSKILPLKVDAKQFGEEVMGAVEVIKKRAPERLATRYPVATPLRVDAFPPCVKKALCGVQHGERNFAIAFLLPTFLSRARILPQPGKREDKISNYMPPRALVDEIMPLITQAALSCNPPLFQDQPHERENILRKLGLDAGCNELRDGKWYACPSCEVVKHNTTLCSPDRLCEKIKNPLAYYIRRVSG